LRRMFNYRGYFKYLAQEILFEAFGELKLFLGYVDTLTLFIPGWGAGVGIRPCLFITLFHTECS
jgi:hypothetical protein